LVRFEAAIAWRRNERPSPCRCWYPGLVRGTYSNLYGGQSIIVEYPNSVDGGRPTRAAPRSDSPKSATTLPISSGRWGRTTFAYPAHRLRRYSPADSLIRPQLSQHHLLQLTRLRLHAYFFQDRGQNTRWDRRGICDRGLGDRGTCRRARLTGTTRAFIPQCRIPTTFVDTIMAGHLFSALIGRSNWWDRLFRELLISGSAGLIVIRRLAGQSTRERCHPGRQLIELPQL